VSGLPLVRDDSAVGGDNGAADVEVADVDVANGSDDSIANGGRDGASNGSGDGAIGW